VILILPGARGRFLARLGSEGCGYSGQNDLE
jgi:hypothetical protein